MPAYKVLQSAINIWAQETLIQDQESETIIVEWSRKIRNWRRYNRVSTVGPADKRGCRIVTTEWDEDYEYEAVIVTEYNRRHSGFGWRLGLNPTGRMTHRIGWFTVKGEHHIERDLDCPGDLRLAGLDQQKPITVSMNNEDIWCGEESPLLCLVTGGSVQPMLVGQKGYLSNFVMWLNNYESQDEVT